MPKALIVDPSEHDGQWQTYETEDAVYVLPLTFHCSICNAKFVTTNKITSYIVEIFPPVELLGTWFIGHEFRVIEICPMCRRRLQR